MFASVWLAYHPISTCMCIVAEHLLDMASVVPVKLIISTFVYIIECLLHCLLGYPESLQMYSGVVLPSRNITFALRASAPSYI